MFSHKNPNSEVSKASGASVFVDGYSRAFNLMSSDRMFANVILVSAISFLVLLFLRVNSFTLRL
jgi:hypothetical protein